MTKDDALPHGAQLDDALPHGALPNGALPGGATVRKLILGLIEARLTPCMPLRIMVVNLKTIRTV